MVAGHQGIKYIYFITFAHVDGRGFNKPPLRKHKRYAQIIFMKIRIIIGTVLILVLTSVTSFCQKQLTKDEIIKTWTTFQTPSNKDSLFRFDIHTQTRATLDKLLMNGVDTLVVYSVRYPGYSVRDSEPCSTMYPVDSYFFWRRQGKDYLKEVNGKCERGRSTTNYKVISFALDNISKIIDECFMSVTYGVVADGEIFRISGGVIDHEPKYEIFIQLGDKFKYLSFTENELTD
jgi:hypothetical protein